MLQDWAISVADFLARTEHTQMNDLIVMKDKRDSSSKSKEYFGYLTKKLEIRTD